MGGKEVGKARLEELRTFSYQGKREMGRGQPQEHEDKGEIFIFLR